MLLQKSKIYERNIFENIRIFEKSKKIINSEYLQKYKVYKNLVLFSLEYLEYFRKAEDYLKKIKNKYTSKKEKNNFRELIYISFKQKHIHDCLLENDVYAPILKLCVREQNEYNLKIKAKTALAHGSIKNYKVIEEELSLRGVIIDLTIENVLFSNNTSFLREKLDNLSYDYWDMLKFCLENLLDNSYKYVLNNMRSDFPGFSLYNSSLLLLILYEKCDYDLFRILCRKCTDLTLILETCIILEKYIEADYIIQNYFFKIQEIRQLVENKKEKLVRYIFSKI